MIWVEYAITGLFAGFHLLARKNSIKLRKEDNVGEKSS